MDFQPGALLIFMHIPKTGGNTLREIIDKQYKENEVLRITLSQIPKLKTQLKKEGLKVIQGHHPFGLHKYCSEPFTYITMLRDPVDRVISNYYFIKNGVKHPLHQKFKRASFEQFLTQKDRDFLFRAANMQTRIASGKYDSAKADLELAKENLSRSFSAVGIVEMFEESVFLMKKALSWGNISYTKKNITKKRPLKDQVPNHIIELIEEKNQLDLDLYQWAKANLVKQLEALDPQSKQELQAFVNGGWTL